ncbi:MAG: bifunctional diaminohydroxyphosphoribosylaminopyrimidine deaminase/5-amino-6-(5-phosphoribosylamino)uracil reductase RibD [Ferruginibacter sp.]
MQRCLQLAKLAAGFVAPNPMVGAVLVYNDIIIGEGYHMKYGEAHAEVNCINSVPDHQKHLIKESVLYVSLEPCNHFGKTPPCSELIIKQQIPKVIIACRDPFEKVNGTGIEKLKAAGIHIITGILEKEAIALNKRFFTFHKKHRPYIILKWAQSNNLKIAGENFRPMKISNEITDRFVHKWRSEEAAIMVGTNTALIDDPSLTTRLWYGHDAVRIVVDSELKLPVELNVLDNKFPTIILNKIKQEETGNNFFYKYASDENVPIATTNVLYQRNINSLIVEGGATLLQSFIAAGLWDEARLITNKEMNIEEGVDAPLLENAILYKKEMILSDEISYYNRNEI